MADRSLDASSPDPRAEGAGSTDEYLLGDVAIAPPLEEFRRTYAKKTRSFAESGEGDAEQMEAYRKAFELGEQLIAKVLGEEASEC